jgi:hypothetical protein
MKYEEESQQALLTPSIAKYSQSQTANSSQESSGEILISAYQHVLDKIVDSIME